MTKVIKEFSVENWVSGEPSETLLRISLSQLEPPERFDPMTLPEAQSKLQKLQNQYFEILEENKSLEEQLYNLQCQIRALQVSNVYTNDLSTEFLKKNQNSAEKEVETQDLEKQTVESLNSQIYLQRRIIDDLMVKLQNMHNRIEYFKDDVSELKNQFQKEKEIVEVEKKNTGVASELYQESLQTIERLKSELAELKASSTEPITIVETKIVVQKSNYQIDNENNLLEFKLQEQVNKLKTQYSTQLLRTQQKNSIMMEEMANNMKKRVDGLKNFYEFRVLSMIQEFSFEEGKFASKILTLTNQISEQISLITELEQRLMVYESKFSLGQENQHQARSIIRNLQSLVDSISLEKSAQTAKSTLEIELIMKQMENTQADIIHDFHIQTKIAEKNHSDALNSLRKTYEFKIYKIQAEFEENKKRIEAKERSEVVLLMGEITRLEQEKTHVEMITESRVQDVVREARSRYLEYEHLLDYNKKQLLEQWKNDRNALIETHETETKNLKAQFVKNLTEKVNSLTTQYESKIQDLEIVCANKVKSLIRKYTDEANELKDTHQREIFQCYEQIEALKNTVANLTSMLEEVTKEKEEIFQRLGIELDEEKIKVAELMSKLENLVTQKIKEKNEYEERIKSMSQVLVDREKVLKIKFDSEKTVAVNHVMSEKYDMENQYIKKIMELNNKLETLKEKYLRAKEKKTVLRINDSAPQRITRELQEKDKFIAQLLRDKANLQTSLDYMNSTVRIFSTQEKTFHTKSNSHDSKTPKSAIRGRRPSRF